MHSCIYEGLVRHRRFSPKPHEFEYRLFYVYLDLDELDEIFNRRLLWSAKRPALAWLKRSDYLGNEKTTLKQAVYERVKQETGKYPDGPVRLLTHLRYFGYIFNPVSFYYCFDKSGRRIETIVAEITNTPWGERYSYVLSHTHNPGDHRHMKFSLSKQFHVSPFMPMQVTYDWRFTQPEDNLRVHMNNFENDQKIFDATLQLNRRPLNGMNCARALTLFPFMTLKVIAGIYWQAFRLFLKRIPFYSHPDKLTEDRHGGARGASKL